VTTALSNINAQATPVLVVIDAIIFNIDADEIESKISKNKGDNFSMYLR